MLKSLKIRVAKMEETLAWEQRALIFVKPGETREEAMERHYREHPQDQDRAL